MSLEVPEGIQAFSFWTIWDHGAAAGCLPRTSQFMTFLRRTAGSVRFGLVRRNAVAER
jgi:hypothetical protein